MGCGCFTNRCFHDKLFDRQTFCWHGSARDQAYLSANICWWNIHTPYKVPKKSTCFTLFLFLKNPNHTYTATVTALCLLFMKLLTFERSGKIRSTLASKSNAHCIWQKSKRFIWNWISTSTCEPGFSFMSMQHLNTQLSCLVHFSLPQTTTDVSINTLRKLKYF